MTAFSVVIPTYNRRRTLEAAIASIEAQTFRDFEIIVVDDGSTDDTIAFLSSLEGRVRWVRQDNAGPGAARNRGAAMASGDYLAFLDSDDLWFPWTLAVMNQAAREGHEPDLIVGTNARFEREDALVASYTPPKFARFACYFEAYRMHRVGVPTQSSCVRTSAFRALGGFTTLYVGEDVDLWLRLGCSSFVWVTAPLLSAQRLHSHSITRDVRRAAAGVLALLRAEKAGRYPGGSKYADVRRHRLAAAARAESVTAARHSLRRALQLYADSFNFNFREQRLKYLLTFPLLCIALRLSSEVARTVLPSRSA